MRVFMRVFVVWRSAMDKEQIAKMKRFRLIGVALLAVFALGAIASASAQAEGAPSFTIGGTRLIAGRTHNFDSRATAPFVLTSELGTVIECKSESTENGVLLGSNPGNPGKDNEIAAFAECKLKAGNGAPNCNLAAVSRGAVTETLTTNPLKSEQVENVEEGHVGKQLLEEFFPASGAIFITLKFTGTGCTVFEGAVTGQVVGESLLDNLGRGRIELGQTSQERTSWIVKFPTAAIKEVWLISEGVGKIQKTKQAIFGEESTQSGEALVLLASTKYVPEPNALWSPLP